MHSVNTVPINRHTERDADVLMRSSSSSLASALSTNQRGATTILPSSEPISSFKVSPSPSIPQQPVRSTGSTSPTFPVSVNFFWTCHLEFIFSSKIPISQPRAALPPADNVRLQPHPTASRASNHLPHKLDVPPVQALPLNSTLVSPSPPRSPSSGTVPNQVTPATAVVASTDPKVKKKKKKKSLGALPDFMEADLKWYQNKDKMRSSADADSSKSSSLLNTASSVAERRAPADLSPVPESQDSHPGVSLARPSYSDSQHGAKSERATGSPAPPSAISISLTPTTESPAFIVSGRGIRDLGSAQIDTSPMSVGEGEDIPVEVATGKRSFDAESSPVVTSNDTERGEIMAPTVC